MRLTVESIGGAKSTPVAPSPVPVDALPGWLISPLSPARAAGGRNPSPSFSETLTPWQDL